MLFFVASPRQHTIPSPPLDTKTLRELNYAVDVDGESPETVARRWLRENGFIE